MGRIRTVTRSLVDRINKLVGYGLTDGVGDRGRGTMCVQACVMAALEEGHDDQPSLCVPQNRINFGIELNDRSGWSSDAARGKGLKRWAIAQLGTSTKPASDFNGLVVEEFYKRHFWRKLKEGGAPGVFVESGRKVKSKSEADELLDHLEQYLEKKAAAVAKANGEEDDFYFELYDEYPELSDLRDGLVTRSDDWEWFDYSDEGNTQIAECAVQACIRMRTEGSEWLEDYESKTGAERDKFIAEQQKKGIDQIKASQLEAVTRGTDMRQFLKKHVDNFEEVNIDDY
jgi:hypothetical protein